MSTPYVGFSNSTLAASKRMTAGESITCPTCGGQHVLEDSKPPMLLSYRCGDASYLAAIMGKSIMGIPSDVSGES